LIKQAADGLLVLVPTRGQNSNALMLAVSQTDDPTGSWYFQKIKTDTNGLLWADFPKLGFNKNWIVVSANIIRIGADFTNVRTYIFDKTNAYTAARLARS
jgi:hypothetical protein